MIAAPTVTARGWTATAAGGTALSVGVLVDAEISVLRWVVTVGDTVRADVQSSDGRAVAGLWYRAPLEPGSSTQTVTVTDACARTATATGPVLVVSPLAPPVHTLVFARPTGGDPNPSSGPAPVRMTAEVVDSHGHELSYLWQSTCAETASGGRFTPSAGAVAPLWHPPTPRGALQCLIRVTAIDGHGLSLVATYVQVRGAS